MKWPATLFSVTGRDMSLFSKKTKRNEQNKPLDCLRPLANELPPNVWPLSGPNNPQRGMVFNKIQYVISRNDHLHFKEVR